MKKIYACNTLTDIQKENIKKAVVYLKKIGYVGTEPFLQEELNEGNKDCYFFLKEERVISCPIRYGATYVCEEVENWISNLCFTKKQVEHKKLYWNVAFASVFYPDETTAEITGFFMPNKINRYEYEDFLREIIKRLKKQGKKTIFVMGNPVCKKEEEILMGIFGKIHHSEYFMKKEDYFVDGVIGKSKTYYCQHGENYIGHCNLNYVSNSWYLHSFYLLPNYRGKGLGTKFLCKLIEDLKEKYKTEKKEDVNSDKGKRKKSNLFLQVSSENIAAVKLYQKTGFQISEQRDYFLEE